MQDAGEKIFQPGEAKREEAVEKHLAGYGVYGIKVEVDGSTAKLSGSAKDMATREKAVLIAGNVSGIDKVDDQIRVTHSATASTSTIPAAASKSGVTPAAGATAQAAARAASPTPAAASNAPQEWSSRTYTVKSGDTLSKIAKEMYGEANKYTQIFEANKPMLKDPDKIYPGQVLRIPKEQ